MVDICLPPLAISSFFGKALRIISPVLTGGNCREHITVIREKVIRFPVKSLPNGQLNAVMPAYGAW